MKNTTGISNAAQLPYKRLTPDEFVNAAKALLKRGWHPIPIGKTGKQPLVDDVTGYNGEDVTDARVYRQWAKRFARSGSGLNLGTRVPVGVIGIDADFYDGKHGRATLEGAEQRWGALPPTYTTTARDDGSGIRWFRLPMHCHDNRAWKSVGKLPGGDVEVIQRHHRLGTMPPSVHHTGARYAVLGPDGRDCADMPSPAELPLLPDAWITGLGTGGGERNPPGSPTEGRAVLADLPDGPMDDVVAKLFRESLEAFAQNGSRYDGMNAAVLTLVRRGVMGAVGVPMALRLLRTEYVRAVAAARGSEHEADREFAAAERDAGRILAGEVSRGWFEDYGAFQPGGAWHEDTPCRGIDRAYALERGWIDADGRAVEVPLPYVPISAAELAAPVPPMEWLIRGVWPRRSFGPMGGEKKTLKTYNLLAIAVAVASGEPLFGDFEVITSGPVLYYVGEGGQRPFQRRLQAVARAYKVELADLPLYAVAQVGSLDSAEFVDGLRRNLDQLQPELIILDPLYAYHPSGVEAQNLYERGRMLADLSARVADESALIVADHFKKTGASGAASLDLDSIAQAGMAQWADSWILQRHRETPDLEQGAYRLAAEFGSRQWGGARYEIDWKLPAFGELESGEVETAELEWAVRRAESEASQGNRAAGRVRAAIEQVLQDKPFELTKTALVDAVGGKKEATRRVLDQLLGDGLVLARATAQKEGGREVKRERLGLRNPAEKIHR